MYFIILFSFFIKYFKKASPYTYIIKMQQDNNDDVMTGKDLRYIYVCIY